MTPRQVPSLPLTLWTISISFGMPPVLDSGSSLSCLQPVTLCLLVTNSGPLLLVKTNADPVERTCPLKRILIKSDCTDGNAIPVISNP